MPAATPKIPVVFVSPVLPAMSNAQGSSPRIGYGTMATPGLLWKPSPLRRPRYHPISACDTSVHTKEASTPGVLGDAAAPEPAPTGGLVNGAPLSWRVLVAEFVATFVFVHLNVVNAGSPLAGPAPNGAAVAAIAASYMAVSGAHFNPAVTLALAATKLVPITRALAFVPVQLFAAVLATWCAGHVGVPVADTFRGAIPAGSTLFQALWMEMVPIVFITVVLFQTAVATPEEGGTGPRLAAAYIGLIVFACASAFTGFFNPCLAFGRAFVLNAWASHWVLWTPVPAAICAALFSEHVFIAPSSGREPKSWLHDMLKRLDMLGSHVKSLGRGALVAYGATNILYYLPVLAYTWLRVGGMTAGAAGFAKAWAVTWAGSQVTKPLRLLISILAAPFVDSSLQRFRLWKKSDR